MHNPRQITKDSRVKLSSDDSPNGCRELVHPTDHPSFPAVLCSATCIADSLQLMSNSIDSIHHFRRDKSSKGRRTVLGRTPKRPVSECKYSRLRPTLPPSRNKRLWLLDPLPLLVELLHRLDVCYLHAPHLHRLPQWQSIGT